MMAILRKLLGLTEPDDDEDSESPSEYRHRTAMYEAEEGMQRANQSRIKNARTTRGLSWEELLRLEERR